MKNERKNELQKRIQEFLIQMIASPNDEEKHINNIESLEEEIIKMDKAEYTYYRGQIDLLESVLQYNRQICTSCIKREELYQMSKYYAPMLEVLKQTSGLTHQELADYLGIQKNHLSNLILKLKPYSILNITQNGRTKLYTLTEIGENMCKNR